MRRATSILQIPVVVKICDRLAVKDNLFFDELTSSVSLNYLAFTTTGRQGSVHCMSCRFAFAKTPSMENVKNRVLRIFSTFVSPELPGAHLDPEDAW